MLERGGALEAELEVAAAADDLGELGAGEEAAPLEVVELVGHALEPELDHVRHCRARWCARALGFRGRRRKWRWRRMGRARVLGGGFWDEGFGSVEVF